MSWISKLLKKKVNIPEVKIPYGEALILNQIADNLNFMSTSDLEKLRDLTIFVIDKRNLEKIIKERENK
jgi:fructose-1,6-bisphosphatase/sedoheptulose 1,7-bisphosphatase-like protein